MFTAACIGSIADNLAGIVDSDGVRKSEAGTGRDEAVEIDQADGAANEGNMLAGLRRAVLRLAKVCGAHDLTGDIDALRQV